MPLTHLEMTNKRGEKNPTCRPYARHYSWTGRSTHFDLTTDQTKVTCTKCAKAAGFNAAVEVKHGLQGTCQCCFHNDWQIVGQNTSLHGYKRPGYGWITGSCMGAKSLPFEVSCEQTKALRTAAMAHLANLLQDLADLNADKVETLDYFYSVYDSPSRKYVPTKTVVTKGAAESVIVEPGNGPEYSRCKHQIPSFEDLRVKAIFSTEGNIRSIKSEIAFLAEKINSWKQVWQWNKSTKTYETFVPAKVEVKTGTKTEPQNALQVAKMAFLATLPAETTCPCCNKAQSTLDAFGAHLMNKSATVAGAAPKFSRQSFCCTCR